MKIKTVIALLFLVWVSAAFFSVGKRTLAEGSAETTLHGAEKLQALFPEGKDAPGWKRASEILFYKPATLWDYINGQAEMYLQYGFQLVATTRYSFESHPDALAVEIYQMKTPRHAFGIYAAERSSDDRFVDIGVQGYTGENVLNFWKGPYYVKLTSFKKIPALRDRLLKFAGVMAGKIPGTFFEPPLFKCFPEAHKVGMSERFIPENFLGHSFLKNAHRLDYDRKGVRYQVFLIENASPAAAKKAFRKYQNFLNSTDAKYTLDREMDHQVIRIKADTWDLLFQYNAFIGGVLYMDKISEADKIMKKLMERLEKREMKEP